jgi:DNA-binding NarL/FixJ family response regulator
LAQLSLERASRQRGRVSDGVQRRARAAVAAGRSALGHPTEDPTGLPEQLTRRETEISRLAAKGLRDKDIADELRLSVRTVESHLATAYRKLGISSRRELVEILGNRTDLR